MTGVISGKNLIELDEIMSMVMVENKPLIVSYVSRNNLYALV